MVYLLFAGGSYYADGGAADLKGAHASEDEARIAFREMDGGQGTFEDGQYDWAHILDVGSLTITVLRQGSYCGKIYHEPCSALTVKEGE